VVERLPSKHEALSSNPNTANKKSNAMVLKGANKVVRTSGR
jgi:hypothetical protein